MVEKQKVRASFDCNNKNIIISIWKIFLLEKGQAQTCVKIVYPIGKVILDQIYLHLHS